MTETGQLNEILAGMKKDVLRAEDIQPGMNLREDLFFSSFEFLELVAELEKGFGVTFSSSDFSSVNFETVEAIQSLIDRKREPAKAPVGIAAETAPVS